MFTFSEMLALVESESSFGAYVCHRRPGGFRANSDLVIVYLQNVATECQSSTVHLPNYFETYKNRFFSTYPDFVSSPLNDGKE